RAWSLVRATSGRRTRRTSGFRCANWSRPAGCWSGFSNRCREPGIWILELLMRLAFLTHEPFYPPSGGGSAEAIYLAQELVRRGHQVHLFCPRIADAEGVRRQFAVQLHEFTSWQMNRYTSLRN